MPSAWREFFESRFQLQLSLTIGVIALQCLVAIWAAASQRYWFWRALAVVGAVLLMAPIRAWEPAWLFGLSSPLIVSIIAASRRWGRRTAPDSTESRPDSAPQPFRYTLRDVVLLILLIGLTLPGVLQIVRQYQPSNWLGWLVSSGTLAVLAVLSYACAQGPRRWLDVGLLTLAVLEFAVALGLGLPVFGGIAIVAALAAYCRAFERRHWLILALLACALPAGAAALCWAGPWMRYWDPVNIAAGSFLTVATVVVALEFVVVFVLVGIISIFRLARSTSSALPWRILAAGILTAAVGAWSVWFGRMYVQMLENTLLLPHVARFDTSKNHFQRIRAIAARVLSLNPGMESIADVRLAVPNSKVPHELQSLYQELLPLLDAPSAVPYDPALDANPSYDWGINAKVQPIYALARSLQAELQSAQAAGRLDEAADYAVAVMRLGDMCGRGGLAVEARIGDTIRREGHGQLARLRSAMPPDRARSVIAALQRSLAEREDPATIRARQLDFEEKTYGWGLRLQNLLERQSEDVVPHVPRLRTIEPQEQAVANVLLQTDLAIRLFEHDTGRLPKELNELVPEYLPAVSLDPYSPQPLKYLVQNGTFMLYSSGYDGNGGGGAFANWTVYNAAEWQAFWNPQLPQTALDFDLDTLTRP